MKQHNNNHKRIAPAGSGAGCAPGDDYSKPLTGETLHLHQFDTTCSTQGI